MNFTNLKLFISLSAIFTVSMLSSCNSYTDKTSGVAGDIAPVEKAAFKNWSYEQVYNAVIGPKCSECHNPRSAKKDQPDLTTYAGAMEYIKANDLSSELYTDVASGDMPKDRTALGPNSVELIRLWILAGAPQFAGQGHEPVDGPPPPPPPDIQITVDPTFASLNANVFSKYCVKCHQPHPDDKKDKSPDGGLDLTSYDTMANSNSDSGLPFITPGDASQSTLWDVMNKRSMPKPAKKARLSPSVAEAIEKWINDGAKNN